MTFCKSDASMVIFASYAAVVRAGESNTIIQISSGDSFIYDVNSKYPNFGVLVIWS